MVARMNTGKNIAKALNYNEEKVRNEKAEILLASGFLKDADKLNFHDKLRHFERLTSLNDRAMTNSLHVSLNFDPSEKLTNEQLTAIAERYMEQIGFGNQPYLVYRHDDAGHPHIHIVTTNIQTDGKRISMHNLGKNESEKARKNIEVEFGLVKADSKKSADAIKIIPVNANKVTYGKTETKRAIANVLMVVLTQYKYSSLAELNAILRQYNVVAERGSENSRMYKGNGLCYRVLDEKGNKTGTPIKASAFYMKPTLKYLENRFDENEGAKEPLKRKIKAVIDWQLNKQPKNLDALAAALEKEHISLVIRKGKEGVIYGLTYVDHKNKVVFNGSDLGKAYSAKAITERFINNQNQPIEIKAAPIQKQPLVGRVKEKTEITLNVNSQPSTSQLSAPSTMDTKQGNDAIPFPLRKRRKKKRKRISL
jgi:hypothetical protein